jgi:hypothetical protein
MRRGAQRAGRRDLSTALVLECDPEGLGPLAVASVVAAALSNAFGPESVVLVRARTRNGLLAELGRLAAEKRVFDLAVVLGHSDRSVLQLTHDHAASWVEAAGWLAPFKPSQAVLLACEAGGFLPSAALFHGVPTLSVLYGCPTETNLAAAFVWLLAYLLVRTKRAPRGLLDFVNTVGVLHSQTLWYRQTRRALRRASPVERIGRVLLEGVLRDLRRLRP